MSTKTISFKATDEQVKFIDEMVTEGHYTSRGELLRSLIRKVENKRLSEKAIKYIEEARQQKGRKLDDIL